MTKRPLTSYKILKCSFDFSMEMTSMKPAGKVSSVRTLLSTRIRRCLTIRVTSLPVKAYLRRLRRKMVRGRDSRNLWGPGDGRGAYVICKMNQYRYIYGKFILSTHVGTAEFVQHPGRGGGKPLQVFFGSSGLRIIDSLAFS